MVAKSIVIVLGCPHCDNQVVYSLTPTGDKGDPTFVVETHWDGEGEDLIKPGYDE